MDRYSIDGVKVLPPLLAEYRFDPVLDIRHNLVSFEQGYSFEYHNMMKNTRDTTFNKDSNFYLTDQYNINDILSLKPLPRQYPETISTFLVFNQINHDPLSALSATSTCLTSNTAVSAISGTDLDSVYITMLNTPGDTGDSATSRQLSAELFADTKTRDTLEQKFYFNVMFVNGYQCLIYHLIDDQRYYLSLDMDSGSPVLQFIKVVHDIGLENKVDQILQDAPGVDGEDIIFNYTYFEEDNLIRLFKNHEGTTKILRLLSDTERLANPLSPLVVMTPTIDPDEDGDIETNSPNIYELTPDTTLRLRPRATKITETDLDSRIFNYKNTIDQNNINVDEMRSTTGLSNNILAHSEYYFLTGTSIPVNLIPLKNQQTDKGNVIPSNKWNEGEYNHRRYNKIFTGTHQLEGTDKIYLDYTSSDHDIEFKPGLTYFNFPQQPDPIKRLNINDTNLITCGAVSSNRPSGSDKVFKKLANYSDYTRWGNPIDEQSGTWLCTWLSGSDDPNISPIWVDRYYNPTEIGGTQALTAQTTYLHNTYVSDTDTVFNSTTAEIYDMPSKLTFEPGCNYAYYRATTTDYENNISNLDPYVIQSSLDNYKTITGKPEDPAAQEYTFMNDRYAEMTNTVTRTTSSRNFTLMFDLDLRDYKKPIGHQLVGNYTDTGIGLFNTNDISPFVFILGPDGARVGGKKQDSSIRIYDNNYNLYNYVTNDSFLAEEEIPSLFKKVIVRELPDSIYCIMTDGRILKMSHDGVISSLYNDWIDKYSSNENAVLQDVTYDNELIYILTSTGGTRDDIQVDTFDMNSNKFESYDISCAVRIPIPEELRDNKHYNYGRQIDYDTPANLIYVKDDLPPYQNNRVVYIGYGESIKASSDTIWVHVIGEIDSTTSSQVNHDMIYGYNTKRLSLLEGYITDNNLQETDLVLQIIDYLIDANDNIWVAHDTSYISKFSNDRDILVTNRITDDQQIMSMVVSKDLTEGIAKTSLVVLAKLTGTDELQLQVGPALHPTDNPDDPAYRKASPYIESGNYITRPAYIDPDLFDDTTSIIYPFTRGSTRFGEHTQKIIDVPSADITGRVTPGDYTLMTEGLDIIVNEDQDLMYGHVYSLDNASLVETKTLPDFPIDDISVKPQMYNHYEYSKENYNKYSKYNLNLKLNLPGLFENVAPDAINLKFDLSEMNKAPYTGYHKIAIVVDNDSGRVEFWVDGNLDEDDRVYTFDKNKHTFHDILTTKLTIGATPYLRDTILARKINRPKSYVCNNMAMKNINCYSKALSYHEQIDVIRSVQKPTSIYWTLPNGLRNYIEGIEHVYNHSLPPSKSNVYDIEIRNSLIQLPQLQQYIENKIKKSLVKYSTGSTKLRNVKWLNELLLT